MKLKERLEGSKFWQSVDRFQAIRLLGKQPGDAGEDRVVAEIYAASYGIEPGRNTDPYDTEMDRVETEAGGIETERDWVETERDEVETDMDGTGHSGTCWAT